MSEKIDNQPKPRNYGKDVLVVSGSVLAIGALAHFLTIDSTPSAESSTSSIQRVFDRPVTIENVARHAVNPPEIKGQSRVYIKVLKNEDTATSEQLLVEIAAYKTASKLPIVKKLYKWDTHQRDGSHLACRHRSIWL